MTDTSVLTQPVQMHGTFLRAVGSGYSPPIYFPFLVPPSKLAVEVNYWDQAATTVRSLALLRDNWDGYGGVGVSAEVCANAAAILSAISAVASFQAPEVTPTSSGTISFAWDTSDVDAVLEIGLTRYSGFVQTIGQPVIYLQGDAGDFTHEDSARLVWAMQNSQFRLASNAVAFNESTRRTLAA